MQIENLLVQLQLLIVMVLLLEMMMELMTLIIILFVGIGELEQHLVMTQVQQVLELLIVLEV